MGDRTIFRLRDIVEAIEQIELLLRDSDFGAIYPDRIRRAAFERFLEILSEASRHIPERLKESEPDIPWQRIADIGNHLRHAYHKVDFEIIWNIWAFGELARLRGAVQLLIAEIDGDQ